MIIEKDSELVRGKREKIKSFALKAKTESSDDETSMSRSEDEEYAMTVRDFKKFFMRRGRFVRQPHDDKKPFQKYRDDRKGKSERKCFRCGDPNHIIEECQKPPRHKDQKAFVRRFWSDVNEKNEERTNDEMCLMAQLSSEDIIEGRPMEAIAILSKANDTWLVVGEVLGSNGGGRLGGGEDDWWWWQ
uniref:Zf-CCHC domain-containing protein/UBN2 domain-containing protein n=1 Tax=Tanacetum cinerariifolium TaxID=118510 RepID=A0A699IJ63_TANCI|nr:zf-CCHC domain-containing protein/UBN2 domain-containing protein [Tanacetum cinerariifolium]